MEPIVRLGYIQYEIESIEQKLAELSKIKNALMITINIDNAEKQEQMRNANNDNETVI